MDTGLITGAEASGLVPMLDQKGLGDVIKPLSREIHLFDTFIAGTTHLKDKSVLDDVKENDILFLQREDNKYDARAILVLNEQKQKMGYVPEKDNVVFSRLLDAGKILSGKIRKVENKGSFKLISISIYLIDF